MGHCNSPAQLGCNGELTSTHSRTAGSDSALAGGRIEGKAVVARSQSVMAQALLAFLRLYQIFLSPFFGGSCKYHPSCSNYSYQAIATHGVRRGVVLALKRLGRCRPFTRGGFDPVPAREELHFSSLRTNSAELYR
jgi:putative membrane protein insertion efficiency factor